MYFSISHKIFSRSQQFRVSLFSFLVSKHSRKCFLPNKISSQRCPRWRSLEQFNPGIVTIGENQQVKLLHMLVVRVCVLGIWINSLNTFHGDLSQSDLNLLLKPKVLCIHFAVVFLHCVCTSAGRYAANTCMYAEYRPEIIVISCDIFWANRVFCAV